MKQNHRLLCTRILIRHTYQKLKLNIFVIISVRVKLSKQVVDSVLQLLVGGEGVPLLGSLDDVLRDPEELLLPILYMEGSAIKHV